MGRKSRLTDGSCSSCRKRRLRCDLDRPRCSRCHESDQECIYGTKVQLKWVGGMAARGHLAAASKSIPRTTRKHQDLTISTNPCVNLFALQDPHFIAYFDDNVMPRFQIHDGLIHLDLKAVMQDQTLQQAILAIAKAHLAMTSKAISPEVKVVRAKARHSALESFRRLLEAGILEESTAQQLFTINVLLCILDGIISPSDELNASICHLHGGFAILSRWKTIYARILINGGVQAHLLSVFTTIDLNHALLKGDKPFFEPVVWLMFANTPTWFGALSPDDPFLAILKAYSEAAHLGNTVHASGHSQDSLKLIDRCLSNLEREFKVPDLESRLLTEADPNNDSWTTFCAFYQLCGTIYLERALRLKSIADDVVQVAVRQGVDMLAGEVLPGMLSHCLIFPVLVLGSHCTQGKDRRAVLEALSPTSSYLSFGSLHLMTKFLLQLWENLDVHATWWECFEPISERAFLF